MLIIRKSEICLQEWKLKSNRKPLILRGERQVGKSTLVKNFGEKYTYYVQLIVEKPKDRKYFETEREVNEIWQEVFYEKNIPNKPHETLLFMDEIQNKGIIEQGCKGHTFALANSKFEIDNNPDRKPTDQNPGY